MMGSRRFIIRPGKQKVKAAKQGNTEAFQGGWKPPNQRAKPLKITEDGKIALDPVEVKRRLLARRKSGNADVPE